MHIDKIKKVLTKVLFEKVGVYDGGLPIMTNKQLAKKHGVSEEEIKKQIEMGIKVELEHDKDKEDAEVVARQHVYEDAKYYTKLNTMENH
jgi:hypothetical protein